MGFNISIGSFYKNPKLQTLSISLFIVLLFIDFYVGSITDVAVDYIQSPLGTGFFIFVLIICLIGSTIVMRTVFSIIREKKSIFTQYQSLLRILQIIILSLSIFLLLDIMLENKLYTLNLNAIMVASYGATIMMSIYVGIKLFKWYKENKNNFALIFGLAIFFLFVNNTVSILLFGTLLSEKPFEINLSTPIVFNFECEDNSAYCIFKENVINVQSYTIIVYFALFWISTAYLLHHHIRKIGKLRFFTLITVPLVLFFFVFVYHYDELYSLSENLNFDESVIFMLQIFIVAVSIGVCGMLFGIGFKSLANLLKISTIIEQYLKMASYGIIMLFISANATIVGVAFPPYGIPNIIFLPFASILFYVGLYYSIIAISNDIKVRRFIKNSAYKELEIMGNFAQYQMMDNMKEKILKMTKKYSSELHQQSNSETMESEEDLKSYLDEAINIFKSKEKRND